MAEKNYRFKQLIVYKETTENEIPTTPKGLVVKGLIGYSAKEAQKTEVNTTLDAGGQGSKKDRGSSDFAGNLDCKTTGDLMPFIVTHAIGEPDAVVSAATDAWTATTAYDKFEKHTLLGDIVSLPGDTDHFLVCRKSGTTGAVEPTATTVGEKLTDGDVTWEVRLPIFKYTGTSKSCLKSFGMEAKATSGCSVTPEDFIKRLQGNFLDSYEFSKSSGGIIHKYSMPVKAMSGVDNVIGNPDGSAFESIVDEAGYTSVTMEDKAFSYDDVMIQIGGAEPIDARDFTMAINRNVTLDDGLAVNKKLSDNATMVVEGSYMLKFTKEQYEASYDSTAQEVKVLYGNNSGLAAHFTLPSVEGDRVDPDFTTEKVAYMTIPLTADGDETTATMSYIVYSEVDYQ